MHVYIESVLPASLNGIKQRNSYILYHSDILDTWSMRMWIFGKDGRNRRREEAKEV